MVTAGRSWIIAGGITLIALALRSTYLDQVQLHPLILVPVAEARLYVESATAMAAGGAVSAVQAPFYTWLLAGLDARPEAARWVQVVLGSLSCALVWAVGRMAFPPAIALVAALLAAAYGPLIFFTGELLPATTAVFLSLTFLTAIAWSARQPDPWRLTVAGVLLGLTSACSPSALVLVPLFAAWIARQVPGRLPVSGFTAGALAATVPFWGSWSLQRAEDLLASFLWLWSGPERAPGLEPYFVHADSPLMAVTMWERGIAFPFGVVAPLALVGMGYRLLSQRPPLENALLLFIAGSIVGALVTGAGAASRLPAAAVLLLFACSGVAEMARRRRVWRQWLPGVMILAALSVGVHAGPAVPEAERGAVHYWRGYAFEQLGMQVNATRQYRRAVDLGVERSEPFHALAASYDDMGDLDRTVAMYGELLKRWPDDARARALLASATLRDGRPAEAAAQYEALLPAAADRTAFLGRLGDARQLGGDFSGAAAAYRELFDLRPDSTRALYELARTRSAAGQAAEAIGALRRLIDDAIWGRRAALQLADLLIEIDRARGQLGDAERTPGWWRQDDLLAAADLEIAEGWLRAALEKSPASIADLWGLGKLLFWQARYAEALHPVLRLSELTPRDFRVHFFRSKLHALTGAESAAQEAFESYERGMRRAEIDERVRVEREALLQQLPGGLQ